MPYETQVGIDSVKNEWIKSNNQSQQLLLPQHHLINYMEALEEIFVNDFKNVCPEISGIQCASYAEGCAVALEEQGHQPPIELLVDGDFSRRYALLWEKPSSKRGWKEPRDFAEAGAIALAFHLTTRLTEYQVIEQAPIGKGGFDYYLGYKEDHPNYDPDNFMNARLEISGTNKGIKELSNRVQKKLEQVKPSDSWNIPAYIAVTDFSKPVTFIKKK